jgi:TatD DNase family protein
MAGSVVTETPAVTRSRAGLLIDSHSHAIEPASTPLSVAQSVLMSVTESDWAAVAQRSTSTGDEGCFGLHPWRAHTAAAGWEDRLTLILERHPSAWVGEIGLDKAARTAETKKCEFAAQKSVFEAQLRIAHHLGRPVSVHCVRAVGTVYNLLELLAKEGAAPPVVAMHSYTGAPEFIDRFLKLGAVDVYFGFSAAINLVDQRRRENLQACLSRVPLDRLLVESDLLDATRVDDAMVAITEACAELRGLPFEAVAAATTDNCRRALVASVDS